MTEETKQEGADGSKKKSKLIIVLLLVLIVAGTGLGAFFAFKKKGEEELIDETKFFKQALLDTFIVNLMTNKNFLKVTIFIEYNPFALERWALELKNGGGGHGGGKADPFALPPELEAKKVDLSDAVIKVLSSKRVDELLSPAGKEKLREELVTAMNESLKAPEQIIVNVRFKEFIIQ
ncbi:MAG: flagellar basal body-associated FliL family protein [Deltaproteobacteria bacterium]|nr:flagellar basal body-associated FliL family protein [Deltaproteobacteria bacterium]